MEKPYDRPKISAGCRGPDQGYLYKYASVQFCRSKDQGGSQAGVLERQMAGPNPQKGPINIPELL